MTSNTSHGLWIGDSLTYIQPRSPGETDAWTAETAKHGRAGGQRLLEVAEAVPSAEVADALNIPAGEPAVVRRRLILLDGKPFELVYSWFPTGVARSTGLAGPRKIRGGSVTLLADLGYRPHRAYDDVLARLVTGQERELLELEDGDPVLVILRVARNRERVYEVTEMISVSEGRRQRYEMVLD